MECLFCKIATGELPSDLVYEDEHVVAFEDIRPLAPTHVLVIPREHMSSMSELDDERAAGRLLNAAARVARQFGLEKGWRLIVNTGEDGGQEVGHLHLHVLGGKRLGRMLP